MTQVLDQIQIDVLEKSGLHVEQATQSMGGQEAPPANPEPKNQGETPADPVKEPANGTATPPKPVEGGETPKGEQPTSEIVDLPLEPEVPASKAADPTTSTNFGEIAGGKFKSQEELNAYISTLAQENAELREGRVQEGSFVNDLSKAFNDYLVKGGDPAMFMQLQGTNVDQLEPDQAFKLDLMWNKGFSETDADTYMKSTYKLDSDYEDESKTGKLRLQIDAVNARQQLKAYQHENRVPERDNHMQAFQSEQESRMEQWFPLIDSAIDEVSQNGVIIPIGKSGKALKYRVEISQDFKDRYEDAIFQFGAEANSTQAKVILNEMIRAEHRGDIDSALAERSRSLTDEEYFNKNHNPSAKPQGDAVPSQQLKGKSVEDQVADFQ